MRNSRHIAVAIFMAEMHPSSLALRESQRNLVLLEPKKNDIIKAFKELIARTPHIATSENASETHLESPIAQLCNEFSSSATNFIAAANRFKQIFTSDINIDLFTDSSFRHWYHTTLLAIENICKNDKIHNSILEYCYEFKYIMCKEFVSYLTLNLHRFRHFLDRDGKIICKICARSLKSVLHKPLLRLNCGHYFHEECVNNSIHESCLCPICGEFMNMLPNEDKTSSQPNQNTTENSITEAEVDSSQRLNVTDEFNSPQAVVSSFQVISATLEAEATLNNIMPLLNVPSTSGNSTSKVNEDIECSSELDTLNLNLSCLSFTVLNAKMEQINRWYKYMQTQHNINRQMSTERYRTASRSSAPYPVHAELWSSQQLNVERRRRASFRNAATTTTSMSHIPELLEDDNLMEVINLCNAFSASTASFVEAAKTFKKGYLNGVDVSLIASDFQQSYDSTLNALNTLMRHCAIEDCSLRERCISFASLMQSMYGAYSGAIVRKVTKTYLPCQIPNSNKEICVICQVNYNAENMIRLLDCGHYFHRTCIDRWLRECFDCPICRKSIIKLVRVTQESEPRNVAFEDDIVEIVAPNREEDHAISNEVQQNRSSTDTSRPIASTSQAEEPESVVTYSLSNIPSTSTFQPLEPIFSTLLRRN